MKKLSLGLILAVVVILLAFKSLFSWDYWYCWCLVLKD